MDDLEDERARARLREVFWVSIIIHMIIFWFLLYGPKYVWNRHIRVVDPSEILKQRQKELTYLDLPPDALKPQKPKQSDIISDKNRTAQSKNPTLDKKTLQQLQAMKKAGPPAPAPPAPQLGQTQPPTPQLPQQQAQQVAPPPQPQPQQRPSQPLQNNDQAKLEAPKPAPAQPNFSTGATTAGQAVQQAARNAMRGPIGGGGDMGANAPSQHPGTSGAVDILSDTMGIDFGPYIRRVIYDTERSWWPIIPESARPPLFKQGRVGIRFRILPDGSVKQMILEFPSGDVALDHAAWGGITGASPYPPLPKEFKGPFLELRFYFLYNIRPEDE
jgi:TonB family protein